MMNSPLYGGGTAQVSVYFSASAFSRWEGDMEDVAAVCSDGCM
jgi:hypothetical protein